MNGCAPTHIYIHIDMLFIDVFLYRACFLHMLHSSSGSSRADYREVTIAANPSA